VPGRCSARGGSVEQTGLTVGKPPLVPLGQSGATDAAFVGNVGEWASDVDAFAQALTALRGERSVRVGSTTLAPLRCCTSCHSCAQSYVLFKSVTLPLATACLLQF
jgi:hypothetical protein